MPGTFNENTPFEELVAAVRAGEISAADAIKTLPPAKAALKEVRQLLREVEQGKR